MFIVEGKLEDESEAYLSLQHARQGKEVLMVITKKDGKTRWSGQDLAGIILSKEDAAELRRML